MASENSIKEKFIEMMDIINKNFIDGTIEEQTASLVKISEELCMLSNLCIYKNPIKNLLKIQRYYIENEIWVPRKIPQHDTDIYGLKYRYESCIEKE